MLKGQRKLLKIIIFVLLLICYQMNFSTPVFAKESNQIQILIINSYHQGFSWTDEETEGMISKLREAGKNYTFSVEYMDWKNYASGINWDYLYNYYQYKYMNKDIDLIMTSDDIALQFALQNRAELFADAPIVFCGVNKEGVSTIIEGYDRVTGEIEEIDPTQTLSFALKINPSLKNIYLINDNTESGLTTGEIMINAIQEFNPQLKVNYWKDLSFEDMKQRAGHLSKDSIIFISTYYRDVNNNVIDMEYVIHEISESSNVPVYGLYDFGLNKGIIGGTLLSGRLQGENAAEAAIRILNGEDPNSIPVFSQNTMRTAFDYHQLERFDIPLSKLPPNSDVINKPFSFFETYRSLVINAAAAFCMLLIFINILLFYVRSLRKTKKALSESNEELTQLYEELTASDEEMRQQYQEIIRINDNIRQKDERLAYQAYHDSLTGLPNKLSLYENAKEIFSSADQTKALLFIDIDNFKYVNDTLGHAFGDKLIIEVSERLTALLNAHCFLYRLSGDEFIIILDQIDEAHQEEEYAAFLLSNFVQDIDSNLHISLSIGIALYPKHGKDLEELLKHADIAMYQAKEAGKKNYMVYNAEMKEVFMERVVIEQHLQKAIDNHEFELYYQPQLDLKTNQITGFEVLLRWNSPELGQVPTLKFIRAAEDTHLIIPLGTWVLQSACEFLKRLEEMGYGELEVAVNFSILQLLQEDFIDIVMNTLDMYRIKPERLEVEITESILIESFERIIAKLQALRDNKVGIALDDFGKGYSSLSYLKQLPITTMKIDKSFIDYISDNYEDDFVRHIISIGKDLGMCVIAEGVEIQKQFDYLREHDCDRIQGYLFSRPKPEAEFIDMLKQHYSIVPYSSNQSNSVRV